MRAVLLIGHGSLRPGSGAAMIRLAARVRESGVAPIVEAGFLNYSRPRFAQALVRCVARGATEVIIQPYFLIPGKFVQEDLPRVVRSIQPRHPNVALRLAEPFGDHAALADLVLKRVALHPPPLRSRRESGGEGQAGLLLMAHGSPDPAANQPIEGVAARIRATGCYVHVAVCYLDLNQPSIPDAIDDFVRHGVQRIVAVPYFLQLGGHVAEDLPAIIAAGRARHPNAGILLAEHLAYDPLLVAVIADRVAEAAAFQPSSRLPS